MQLLRQWLSAAEHDHCMLFVTTYDKATCKNTRPQLHQAQLYATTCSNRMLLLVIDAEAVIATIIAVVVTVVHNNARQQCTATHNNALQGSDFKILN